MRPAECAKAIYGAVVTGVGAAGTALIDGHVTGVEYCTIAGATLAAFGVVFGVSNASAPDKPTAPVVALVPAAKPSVAVQPEPMSAGRPMAPLA